MAYLHFFLSFGKAFTLAPTYHICTSETCTYVAKQMQLQPVRIHLD